MTITSSHMVIMILYPVYPRVYGISNYGCLGGFAHGLRTDLELHLR